MIIEATVRRQGRHQGESTENKNAVGESRLRHAPACHRRLPFASTFEEDPCLLVLARRTPYRQKVEQLTESTKSKHTDLQKSRSKHGRHSPRATHRRRRRSRHRDKTQAIGHGHTPKTRHKESNGRQERAELNLASVSQPNRQAAAAAEGNPFPSRPGSRAPTRRRADHLRRLAAKEGALTELDDTSPQEHAATSRPQTSCIATTSPLPKTTPARRARRRSAAVAQQGTRVFTQAQGRRAGKDHTSSSPPRRGAASRRRRRRDHQAG